jgi:hypothetical protein
MVGRRRTVGGLLTIAFATVITLMALLGLVRVFVTEPLYHRVVAQRDHLFAMQEANHRVRTLFDRAHLALEGYLASGDKSFLVPYEAARQEAPIAMIDLLRQAGPGDPEAAEVEERTDTWWRQADTLITGPTPPKGGTAAAVNQGTYRRAVVASDAFNDNAMGGLVEVARKERMLGMITSVATLGITLVAVAAAVVIGVRTTRRIVEPLGHVVDVLQRFARRARRTGADAEGARRDRGGRRVGQHDGR